MKKGYFIIHHARDGENKDLPYLHVRKIFWSKEGWPMVSPERYAGEENRKIITNEIIGNWEFLIQDKENHGIIESQIAKFENSGKLTKDELIIGSWVKNDNNISLTFDDLGIFAWIIGWGHILEYAMGSMTARYRDWECRYIMPRVWQPLPTISRKLIRP